MKEIDQSYITQVFQQRFNPELTKASVKVIQCKNITPKQKAQSQYKPKIEHQKPLNKVFVKSSGTDQLDRFANQTNADFFKKVQILKRNESFQHKSGPSTSYVHKQYSHSPPATSRFIERRACFKCGEIGHVVSYCHHITKGKAP